MAYRSQGTDFYVYEGGVREIEIPPTDKKAEAYPSAKNFHGTGVADRLLAEGALLKDADLRLGRPDQ